MITDFLWLTHTKKTQQQQKANEVILLKIIYSHTEFCLMAEMERLDKGEELISLITFLKTEP